MLEEKGRNVWTIAPDAKVFDALKLMAEKEVGALIVLKKGAVVGIISLGDVVKSIISRQKVTIRHLENHIMGKCQ